MISSPGPHTYICYAGIQQGLPCNCGGMFHEPASDVNHPKHYTSHPSGVECIVISEHMTFNVGNAIKYLWRAGLKNRDAVKDLQKARWYVEREITRLSNVQKDNTEEQRDASGPATDRAGQAPGISPAGYPTGSRG